MPQPDYERARKEMAAGPPAALFGAQASAAAEGRDVNSEMNKLKERVREEKEKASMVTMAKQIAGPSPKVGSLTPYEARLLRFVTT